ncbi:MAG: hypothetical protein RR869_08705 [Lachnospiraceae bacterium]
MKNRKKAIHKSKSFFLVAFTAFTVFGYAIFLTSKLWFPAPSDLIKATSFYEKQKLDTYEMYLTRWDYAKSGDTMEVTIEMDNSDVLDKHFKYEAMERKDGILPMKVVAHDSKFVILRITEVKESWREVSLRIQSGKEEPLKLYTNKDKIHRVKSLPRKTPTEYLIGRLQDQITYNQSIQKEYTKTSAHLQKQNKKLEVKMKELNQMEYLTEDQLQENKSTIEKAEGQLKSNQEALGKIKKDSEMIFNKNTKIQEQIESLRN